MMEVSKQDAIIEVVGLNKQYKGISTSLFRNQAPFQVLKNISFSIYESETVGVIGQNDSGKSTLASCVGGLESIDDSTVYFRGQCLNTILKQEKRNFRKNVQFLYQYGHNFVNPRMKVYHILCAPLISHQLCKGRKEIRKRIDQLLEEVRLEPDILTYKPKNLTGGQYQQVAIARVLSLKPQLVICDEIFSGLDVSAQAGVIQLLNTIKQKYNISFLFISHNLGVVRSFADQIIVLNKGEIVEQAPGEHIFKYPQHAFTKSLLSSL